jgi:hypothetical protein
VIKVDGCCTIPTFDIKKNGKTEKEEGTELGTFLETFIKVLTLY